MTAATKRKASTDPRAQIHALRAEVRLLVNRVAELTTVLGGLDNRMAESFKRVSAVDSLLADMSGELGTVLRLRERLAEQAQLNRHLQATAQELREKLQRYEQSHREG